MNFPINYTIQVHYEEVFRLRNISRLMVSLYPTDTVPNQPSDTLKATLFTTSHTNELIFPVCHLLPDI